MKSRKSKNEKRKAEIKNQLRCYTKRENKAIFSPLLLQAQLAIRPAVKNFYLLTWTSHNLRFANLQVPLCGWLPSPCEPLQLSWAALGQIEINCSALSQQIASDCKRALVGLLVSLSLFECNLYARPKSGYDDVISDGSGAWYKQFLTFLPCRWLSFPFTSFFSSNSLDRWLSKVSHDEYWLLVSITSADGDGIVPPEAFLTLSLPALVTNSSSIYRQFFFCSHEDSQHNHSSAAREFMTLSFGAQLNSDLKRKQKTFINSFNPSGATLFGRSSYISRSIKSC